MYTCTKLQLICKTSDFGNQICPKSTFGWSININKS